MFESPVTTIDELFNVIPSLWEEWEHIKVQQKRGSLLEFCEEFDHPIRNFIAILRGFSVRALVDFELIESGLSDEEMIAECRHIEGNPGLSQQQKCWVETILVGQELEYALEDGEVSDAAFRAVMLTIQSLYRPYYKPVAGPISYSLWCPLFGPLAEDDTWSQASLPYRALRVIERARLLWGVDSSMVWFREDGARLLDYEDPLLLDEITGIPWWHIQTARIIKSEYYAIFSKARVSGSGWTEETCVDDHNAHYHLDYQLDWNTIRPLVDLRVMKGLTAFSPNDGGSIREEYKKLPTWKVYAAFAIGQAGSLLNHCANPPARKDEIEHMLLVAEGFLMQAYELSEEARFRQQLSDQNSDNAKRPRHKKALQEVINALVLEFMDGRDDYKFAHFVSELRERFPPGDAYDTGVVGCTSLEIDLGSDRLAWTDISGASAADDGIQIENIRDYYKRALKKLA